MRSNKTSNLFHDNDKAPIETDFVKNTHFLC